MGRPVIEVQGLWTCYEGRVVHRDIDLAVEQGEVIGLVGGSGSGKTTLLRQMLGLERPTRGRVRVLDRDLRPGVAPPELRHRWGVLFQGGGLFSALSVFDNVAFPLRELRLLDEAVIRDLVLMKLEQVQIGREHMDKTPSELSGGMVKRVALARALAVEPELLFLDEPTAGLDPDRSEAFEKLIESLRRELCLTVVLVTHDIQTLVALADRVAVLADQRLVAVGSLEAVVNVQHPFIENFFQGARARAARELRELSAAPGGQD